MADIERFTPDDRRGIEQLHRRTLGNEAAERLRLHWDWARRNPAIGVEPPYWVVREGPTLIAGSALTPVKVSIAGTEVAGTWSSDPLVVAERQRQGLGGSLLRAWDRGTGVALGAALSTATRGRLDEMRWPKPQPLPCLVKPISRRAFRIPTWPVAINRLVSAIALPLVRVVSRTQPLKEEVEVGPALRLPRRSAVGVAGAAIRAGREARRQILELEVRRAAARALHDCAVAARRRGRRLRRLPAPSRAAGPRHPDRRSDGGSRRRARHQDAGALGRSRSAHERLGQDSLLRHQRGVPQGAPAIGILRREVGHRSHRESQRGAGAEGILRLADDWHFTLGDGELDH